MKNGIYKPASAYAENGCACLRMYNIGDGKLVWRDIKRMRLSKNELTEYQLLPGDLLVNRVNSRELVGKTAVIPEGVEPLVFESKNIRLRLVRDKANPRFINYQLLLNGRRHFSANAQQVVGMASVNQKQLADFSVVLPPLDIQQEAVQEIEKQFSRLDEAVANLKRVKANLKRYKAAVLKAAVEGKLTEDWRKDHSDVEPASKLLERMLAERRTKWSGKGEYREPTVPDTTDLPSLPKGWIWATVEQLSIRVQYGSSVKTHEEAKGVPVLRMGNIEDGRLLLDSLKYLPKYHDEFPELFLREGDILFNRTNSAELVGKTAVYKGKPSPCSFASYLIRVRLVQGCAPELLAYFINSAFGRAWVAQVVSQQVGQANVNGTKLQALGIPLPPLGEQEQIIAEVERRLSVIEDLESAVQANLTRADRLRQSILERAFSGRLPIETKWTK